MPTRRWTLAISALWLTSAAVHGALCAPTTAGAELRSLRVRLSWGYRSPQAAPWFVKLVPAASGMQIQDATGWNLEESDGVAAGVGRTTAGAGDVDGVEFTLKYQEPAESKPRTEHSIWNYLLTHSDAGTVNRLRSDPAFQVDPRLLTVQLNEQGTRGFSVSVDQLLRERALWVSDLDVFLAAGDEWIALEQHQAAIEPRAEVADQRVTGIGGDLRTFRGGQVQRLALEASVEDHYMGGIVDKYFGQDTGPIYWAVWTNLVRD
jgi:hypothetical protein